MIRPTLSSLITQLRKRGEVTMRTWGDQWRVSVSLSGDFEAPTLRGALVKALREAK